MVPARKRSLMAGRAGRLAGSSHSREGATANRRGQRPDYHHCRLQVCRRNASLRKRM